MVFRHLVRVPHYSVVVNIMKFYRHDRDSNTEIAAVKIKHANHYTIGCSHETEVNSNRFEFTSVIGLSLHSVYMTSREVKLTWPLISLRSKWPKWKFNAVWIFHVNAPDRSENEDILLFCELKVNLCSGDKWDKRHIIMAECSFEFSLPVVKKPKLDITAKAKRININSEVFAPLFL